MINPFRRGDSSAELARPPLRERPGPLGFLAELWAIVSRSDFFFLAGAITFNVLLAGVPLLLLVAGLVGFVLTARFGGASPELIEVVLSYFPAVEGDIELTQAVRGLLGGLMEERTGFTILAALFLLWISTRLVSTLRVVLRQVFHVEKDRGILVGKLFDIYVVVVGGFLLVLNVGVTVASRALGDVGAGLGLASRVVELLQTTAGHVISFSAAWILFFLLYRYVPARHIPFRTATVGATFATVVFEVMKGVFAWYATSVANYSTAYGSLAVVAILFLWIYYSAAVFILGGQVARVYEKRRVKRMEAIQETREETQEGGGSGTATAILAVLSILASSLLLPAGAAGQDGLAPFGGNGKTTGFLNGGEGVVLAEQTLERNLSLDRPLVQTDGPYIVVHIAENRVLVMEGTEVVWSARAGTGTGYQLEGQGREWTFTTPVGLFHVLRKEKDPVWIAPDWWYVEGGRAIPAPEDRYRSPNTLGTSALFLGDGIAIHGTDRPQLLIDFIDPDDRRVSHGCIRLTNEAARELYHRVEVGTPVLIF